MNPEDRIARLEARLAKLEYAHHNHKHEDFDGTKALSGLIGSGQPIQLTPLSFFMETGTFEVFSKGDIFILSDSDSTGNEGDIHVHPVPEPATTDSKGFLFIPQMVGPPTGTPTAGSNGCPIVYDRTNSDLYAYNFDAAAWKKVNLA